MCVRSDSKNWMLGRRHTQVFLLFICFTLNYCFRTNLSVGLVAMTDRNSTNPNFEDFDWNEQIQSVLLSSFFWGYIVTQVPAGLLADKYGGKYILLITTCISGLTTILTPICASAGWQVLCAMRVISGLSQGFTFPAVYSMLSNWLPISERGQLGTLATIGIQFGTVIMLAVSGYIAVGLGWPSIFYIPGGLAVVWAFFWIRYASNSPAEDTYLSQVEKDYIESGKSIPNEKQKITTPWLAILTSPAVLSLALSISAHLWGFWTLLTKMPAYLKYVLNFDIKQNSLLSALPYFTNICLSLVFIALASYLSKKKIFSLEFSRKFFNSIGLWIPMASLIGLAFTDNDSTTAVVLLVVAVGSNSAIYLGFQFNAIDLSPNFSGTIFGIVNFLGNIMPILAPLLIGFVVTDETDPFQWRIIFLVAAGFYFVGNFAFIIFGKTSEQSWNKGYNNVTTLKETTETSEKFK